MPYSIWAIVGRMQTVLDKLGKDGRAQNRNVRTFFKTKNQCEPSCIINGEFKCTFL